MKEPFIQHRHNFDGALCADILTPTHWQSTYTLGKLLLQLGNFLHDKACNPAVIGPGQYNLKKAGKFFTSNIARPDHFGRNY